MLDSTQAYRIRLLTVIGCGFSQENIIIDILSEGDINTGRDDGLVLHADAI